MEDFIEIAHKKGAEYCELNKVESNRNSIEISNGETREVASSSALLHSARVLVKGAWGHAFSLSDNFKALIDDAVSNAAASTMKNFSFPDEKGIKKNFNIDIKKELSDYNIDEKQKILKNFMSESLKNENFKEIKNLTINYIDIEKKHKFVNSFGSTLKFNDSICSGTVIAYATRNGKMENFFDNSSIHGGFEAMDKFEKITKETCKTAISILDAKPAKGGIFNVVIDPDLAGVFAHEAVGHACEGDIVLAGNSALGNKMDSLLGNKNLNIGDDGNYRGWGYCPFDSEGVMGSDTKLISRGKLVGFMHSRETAAMMNTNPTGNGRAQGIDFRPIPRMTNTYIKNGNVKFDEMISELNNGYYLKGSMGGQVDTSLGEFLFNAKEGFAVRDGEICERIKGASMIGNMLSTLKNIKMIGNECVYHGGGACGKAGQRALTGEGSPNIMINEITLGGQ